MRLTIERVRELLAVDGTRRMYGGVLMDLALVRDLAADLLDAHAALATERERTGAAAALRNESRAAGEWLRADLAATTAAAVTRADELADHLLDALSALDAHHTRADAAEADRDYWREQAIGMAPCVDGMRAITSLLIPGGTGCIVNPERVVAAVAALRAIIAGRTVAPSDEEIAAHAAARGSWLVRYCRDETTTTRVGWHPLDATGRPTTWPTGGGL